MNLSPAESRSLFQELCIYRDSLYVIRDRLSREAQAAYNSAVGALFVATFGKRKKFSHALMKETAPVEVAAHFSRLLTVRDAGVFAAAADDGSMRQLDGLIARVGSISALHAGPEFIRWKTVSESAYASQGYGALRYAKSHADLDVLHAQFHGLEARLVEEIRTIEGGVRGPFKLTDFHIEVKVSDETDLRVLNLKPSVSYKEAVRFLMKSGVNPRVMNPYLEADYAARLGLDAFGNDFPKPAAPKATPAASETVMQGELVGV